MRMPNQVHHGRPAEILLVEDSAEDALLMRRAFNKSKLALNLHHVKNGQECMSFLRKQAKYSSVPTPDLILLDLYMPIMNGREVLAQLAADPSLSHLPVVVMTTVANEHEVLKAYKLGCSSYITKPVDFDNFCRAIQTIADYWFTVVVIPRAAREEDSAATAS